MTTEFELNDKVTTNFNKVKLWFVILPFLTLLSIFLFFALSDETNFIIAYGECQKDLFFYLNEKLSQFPNLQVNLTQLGDVITSFALLTAFIRYAPKLWEALLPSALISLIVSATLKNIFAMPRPPEMYNRDSFTVVGRAIAAPTSLPSGHSIATFIVITLVLFAFMPKRNIPKMIWCSFILLLGIIICLTRVGLGAHFPFDVLIGGIIGFIIAIIGIKISKTVNLFGWLRNKKLYPIFILVITIWGIFIGKKIVDMNLPIFYVALMSLVFSLFIITNAYVKKN